MRDGGPTTLSSRITTSQKGSEGTGMRQTTETDRRSGSSVTIHPQPPEPRDMSGFDWTPLLPEEGVSGKG